MSFTENSAYLHAIRIQMEGGDTQGAMKGMLDLLTDLSNQLVQLKYQVEYLEERLEQDEDFDMIEDADPAYVVECPGCGCMMEVPAELLEEEDAELSCPECDAVLSLL